MAATNDPTQPTGGLLTQEELAITLELANVTTGAASSTLAMLIDPNLEIGQAEVKEYGSIDHLIAEGMPPSSVMAVLRLQNGFTIPMAYILDTQSALVLASVMMGNTGPVPEHEISDIELSAVGEAISQMMGAAANSISQFLSHPVDITAPDVVSFSRANIGLMIPEMETNAVVVVKYRLTGSSVLPECELLQVTPIIALRQQIDYVKAVTPETPIEDFETARNTMKMEESNAFPPIDSSSFGSIDWGEPAQEAPAMQPEPVAAFAAGGAFAAAPQEPAAAAAHRQTPDNPVTVQPVEFPSFDNHVPAYGGINKNLELVMDVCLNLTVELGRTEIPIKEVLELTRGSVIELNRVAGESVDLFANGKMIAKGEVVVIEDNFGLRITSIVSPADRLRGL